MNLSPSNRPLTGSMDYWYYSALATTLRLLLLASYFLGGIPRLVSRWPWTSLHDRICRQDRQVAVHLPPPFRVSSDPWIAGLHMRYVGVLMVAEALLLGLPQTKGSLAALGLGSALAGAGFWGQRWAGLPCWRPAINFCLGWVVYLMSR